MQETSRSTNRDEQPGCAIVVFARLPVPGKVKTRLAAGVGPQAACEFYRACAEHTFYQAARCTPGCAVAVHHSSDNETEDVAAWLAGAGLELPCVRQVPGTDLGAKMFAAMRAAWGEQQALRHHLHAGRQQAGQRAPQPAEQQGAGQQLGAPGQGGAEPMSALDAQQPEGGPGPGQQPEGGPGPGQRAVPECCGGERPHQGPSPKVLIIGTDIPDISAALLRRAAAALDEHEMVIGPALDGGYYLLGLTRLDERLFQGMAWSTPAVLHDTLQRAAAAGVRTAPLNTLPALRDIDTIQDLAEWVWAQAPAPEPPCRERTDAGAAVEAGGGVRGAGDVAAEQQAPGHAGDWGAGPNARADAGLGAVRTPSRSVMHEVAPAGCAAAGEAGDAEEGAVAVRGEAARRQVVLLEVSRAVVVGYKGAAETLSNARA